MISSKAKKDKRRRLSSGLLTKDEKEVQETELYRIDQSK